MNAKFTQPYATEKCVVFCITGLLCYINRYVQPHHWNAHWNVVKYPSPMKLFGILLLRFYVGLWSRMPMLKDLMPLLENLFLTNVRHIILFIFSREYCEGSGNFLWYYKVLMILYSKHCFRDVCKPC